MVKISPLTPYLAKEPVKFCTKPYDVIEKEEEIELKKNPDSLVHLILPDGEGDIKYSNAAKILQKFKDQGYIFQEKSPSIFVFRQESSSFAQQGFILGLSFDDYENGHIVKHEKTREKPLVDRTKIYESTYFVPGLVWTVFQSNTKLKEIMEQIKKKPPRFSFEKFGYLNLLWQETDEKIIAELGELFSNKKVYIADGHHRAAAAAEYRKQKLKKLNHVKKKLVQDPSWQYMLAYVASDDQVRILAYNRVIRKLAMRDDVFLDKLQNIYTVVPMKTAFNPSKKHEVALCLKGNWYKLTVKDTKFANKIDSLDVSILQDKVLNPILGIKDPRADENLFFVGGIQDPKEMEKFVVKDGNAIFFNLFPVAMKDIEEIADAGGVMPPKSTWFDPKLLSGLVMQDIQ